MKKTIDKQETLLNSKQFLLTIIDGQITLKTKELQKLRSKIERTQDLMQISECFNDLHTYIDVIKKGTTTELTNAETYAKLSTLNHFAQTNQLHKVNWMAYQILSPIKG